MHVSANRTVDFGAVTEGSNPWSRVWCECAFDGNGDSVSVRLVLTDESSVVCQMKVLVAPFPQATLSRGDLLLQFFESNLAGEGNGPMGEFQVSQVAQVDCVAVPIEHDKVCAPQRIHNMYIICDIAPNIDRVAFFRHTIDGVSPTSI
jgi:hypothetical protein